MGFGLVQGADGKKFKTRSGDVVRLRDLLDEAASRAAEELRKRVESIESEGGDGSPTVDEAKLQRDSEAIGVAAVKYFDLRQNRKSDYRFSFDAILDPKVLKLARERETMFEPSDEGPVGRDHEKEVKICQHHSLTSAPVIGPLLGTHLDS